MAKPLKLLQGQIWKLEDIFLRIVRLERLAVEYKSASSTNFRGGTLHQATKKQFCRLLKTAVLQPASSPNRDASARDSKPSRSPEHETQHPPPLSQCESPGI